MDDLFSHPEFAEIEVDFGAPLLTPSQPVDPGALAPSATDPIREMFYKMRSLAVGNPFARNDAGLFYKQAKFMEDFSDDYQGDAQFSMYSPYYQHMGYEQLRTYFTWRAHVRRDEILPTSLSYVFLYIYELLSGVGVKDPADGLDRLMALWTAYRQYAPALDGYLPSWLKDYHVYYPLPRGFADFVAEHGLESYYAELLLFDAAGDSLALWNNVSNYDVTKSKFYGDGNAVLLADCFDAVLRGVRELCARRNVRLAELFLYKAYTWVPWYPFARALFHPWYRQSDRLVKLPGGQVFVCTDNRWTANLSVYYAGRRELAGYFIKKTESCLRRAVSYRFKLTADPGGLSQAFQKLEELGIPFPELERAIEDTVVEFQRARTRTVVTVDHGNLARIRSEALGTQKKLIVPEDEEDEVLPSPAAAPAEQISPQSPEDGWAALKMALSGTEREALIIALGGGDVKPLASKNGIMPEVLADGINEKAADFIGDSLLEFDGDLVPYEEYRAQIAELLGGAD